MNAAEVVKHMVSAIESRTECLALTFDRGLGNGMKIENWILTEMLAKLVELKADGILYCVEGEHKYPIKKANRYEHCDLWWCAKGIEHWLEVKTLRSEKDLDEVVKDLGKRCRLRDTDVFHHLSVVFLELPITKDFTARLSSAYEVHGFSCEADWGVEINGCRRLCFMFFSVAV